MFTNQPTQLTMKKLCITAAAFVLALSATAGGGGGSSSKEEKYCAEFNKKTGMLEVFYQDKLVTTDMKLEDGTIIKPNGIILYTDGTQTYLSENQCIAIDGRMVDKYGIDGNSK